MSARTAILAIFTAAAFIAVFRLGLASSTPPKASRIMSTFSDRSADASGVTNQLGFTLAQTSESPPTVRVSMKNNSPSETLTVLDWDTPLDPNALALGVFTITDAATGQEVPSLHLKLNRKLPPERDSLVEIAPGATVDKDVVLDPELVPVESGKEYTIQAKGRFRSVWPVKAKDIGQNQLETLGSSSSNASTGTFQSDSIQVKVQ